MACKQLWKLHAALGSTSSMPMATLVFRKSTSLPYQTRNRQSRELGWTCDHSLMNQHSGFARLRITVGTPLPVIKVHSLTRPDIILQELLAQFKGRSYAVLFATTPVNSKAPASVVYGSVSDVPNYESEFQEPLRSELKRETGIMRRAEGGNKVDTRPLFEKYQFFTPGMNLLISLLGLHLNIYRNFHGTNGYAPPFGYPLCGYQGYRWPRGVVRRVREGDGPCSA